MAQYVKLGSVIYPALIGHYFPIGDLLQKAHFKTCKNERKQMTPGRAHVFCLHRKMDFLGCFLRFLKGTHFGKSLTESERSDRF